MATYSGAGQLIRQFSTTAARHKLAPVPVKLYGIEGRYATALYSAATKQKQLDTVEREIKSFQNLMKTDKKLADFLTNPSYQRQAKRAAMTKVLQSQKYSDITSNFFGVLSENGRLPRTAGVLGAFNKLMSAHRGEILCTVTTAKPLSGAEEKELRAALQGFAKQGQSISIEMKLDPAILGGMVVNIGDKFIDMSIATKMKTYTQIIREHV